MAKNDAVAIEQLAKEDFVLYCREGAPTVFDSIVALCRKTNFSPRIATTSRSWQSVLTMVEAGEGVALLPACIKHLRAPDAVFRPLENTKVRLDAYIIWRRNDPDVLIQKFLSLLRDAQLPLNPKPPGRQVVAKRHSRAATAKK